MIYEILFASFVLLLMVSVTIYVTQSYLEDRKAFEEFMAGFQNVELSLIPATYRGRADSKEVGAALNLAHECLRYIWPDELIVKNLANIKILVMGKDMWDTQALNITGLRYLDLGIVAVGPKLDGLCHELIHILENRIDGVVDFSHNSWVAMDNPKAKALVTYILERRK